MSRICESITECIGNTPLLRLRRLSDKFQCRTPIIAKLEAFNPGGSLKDRAALGMLQGAMDRGDVDQDTLVIEATSGNSGVSLCMVAAAMGLRATIVMPDNAPTERRMLMRAFGAELIFTPAAEGLAGAEDAAKKLCANSPNAYMPRPFENEDNSLAHRETTAAEILACVDPVDYLVAGVGTGGAITGCAEGIKRYFPECRVVAVEPVDSPVLSGGFPSSHALQGIGAGFVPTILNDYILDEVIRVRTPDSFELARRAADLEGVLCGISSGAALAAAVAVAQRPEAEGKNLVVLLPDTGERYLNAGLFDEG